MSHNDQLAILMMCFNVIKAHYTLCMFSGFRIIFLAFLHLFSLLTLVVKMMQKHKIAKIWSKLCEVHNRSKQIMDGKVVLHTQTPQIKIFILKEKVLSLIIEIIDLEGEFIKRENVKKTLCQSNY